MLGTTVSHYRITHEIGGGGQGVVYRGEDLDGRSDLFSFGVTLYEMATPPAPTCRCSSRRGGNTPHCDRQRG